MARGRALFCLGFFAALSGCTAGPDPGFTDLQPLVFPSEGRLGDLGSFGTSVMVVIDSNAIGSFIDSYDATERHDLTKARVTASLRDPATSATADADVRHLFSAQIAPTSSWHNVMQGATATVVVVDLPASDLLNTSTPYPFTGILDISVDGNVIFQPRVIVTGSGGAPTALVAQSVFAGDLNNLFRPDQPFLLRVRPKRAPGTFTAGQPFIGGIEFDVTYPSSCYFDIRAVPASDASDATAITSDPQTSPGGLLKVHVVAIDPKGIDLAYLSDVPGFDTVDETLAGEGPLLDLVLADAGNNCTLDAAQFSFSNLRVTDLNGNLMFAVATPATDTSAAPSASANLRLYTLQYPGGPL